MPHDPTFEISYREYGPHPEPDEFAMLLSIGCEPDEAAEILDIDFMTFGQWLEIYGENEIYDEEVTAQDSTLELI